MEKELFEEMIKNQDQKIEKIDKRLSTLEKTYAVMEKLEYRMCQVENSVNKIDKTLEDIREQKGAKWDKLVEYIFYAFVSLALVSIGLK